MNGKYKKNSDGTVLVLLTGYIVDNEDAELYRPALDVVCPKDIAEALELAAGNQVVVQINSPGGNLIAGGEIYTMLMDYIGPVELRIMALAGSAATFPAMASAKAGNRCTISPTAMMFIHNVQSGEYGDYRTMERATEKLRTANKAALAAYRLKTGLPDEELAAMMDADTWLDADTALAKGFVDEIMFTETAGQPDKTTALANMLHNCSSQLVKMSAVLHGSLATPPPPQAHTPPDAPPDDTQAEAIAYATAMLNIEKNRY